MHRVLAGAAIIAAALLGGCATQGPDLIPIGCDMPESSVQAAAPTGFVSFCLRFATQCIASPGSATAISLTDKAWKDLTRINRQVNDSIWPEDDEKHYGRSEFWTIPTDGLGDCDDYAVTKRKDLIDAGFPISALRLAVVYSPQSGRHAVLTVKTDKGDLVLDNLRNDIVSWNTTGFLWIERQAATDPLKWASLQQPMVAQNDLQIPGKPNAGGQLAVSPAPKGSVVASAQNGP